MMTIEIAKRLSDMVLIGTLRQSLGAERVELATSLACLVAIAARDLHVRQGSSSLFEFLTRDMHLSQPSASKRAAAVRAIGRYPEMLDLVRMGRLHLSNISLVSRHLTDSNKDRLIALAQTETHRNLERSLMSEFSKPATRDSLRPTVFSAAVLPPPIGDQTPPCVVMPPTSASAKSASSGLFGDTGTSPPIVEIGSRVAATLDQESTEALEFLRQAMPGKTLGEILGLAVQELRDRRDPQRKAARADRRMAAVPAEASTANKRLIPAALRSEVARRDQYRCTYVAPDGRRCEARHRLEFDHIVPRAFGGDPSLSNLRLTCKAHNLLAAKDSMGKAFIESHFGRQTKP